MGGGEWEEGNGRRGTGGGEREEGNDEWGVGEVEAEAALRLTAVRWKRQRQWGS
jgi:hypothetical protein